MSMSLNDKCKIESFKSVLEEASNGSDNFAYTKNDGVLLFGYGVNANRNKANHTWLDNGENKPEADDIE
ncbi:hypothetical protein [Solidesulfovibrio sp. C21]|uniref:hypothetical protein n=1 Tax=Solidesulfovibrio sp. C21 TaxID=3398613 RepID=UPI0039FCF86F